MPIGFGLSRGRSICPRQRVLRVRGAVLERVKQVQLQAPPARVEEVKGAGSQQQEDEKRKRQQEQGTQLRAPLS